MIRCSDVVVVVPHYSYTKNIPLIVSELSDYFEVVVVTITFISSRCSRHPLVTRHSAGSSLTSVRALDRAGRVLIKHPVARSGSLGPDEEVKNR